MHRPYRNAGVNNIHTRLGHVCRDSSAAAGVDLTEFSGLPRYGILVENPDDLGNEVTCSFTGTRLASGTDILLKLDTVRHKCCIGLIGNVRILGIKSIRYVS